MIACRQLVVLPQKLPPGLNYEVRQGEREVTSSGRKPTRFMMSEQQRLRSYKNWPDWSSQQPSTLARAGFYYTGIQDRVTCAFCHGVLKHWRPSDDPVSEHRSHFPSCPFVRGDDCGNIPLEYPSYMDMKMEANRLRSFTSACRYPGQTHEELARAGFFHHGDDTKPDRVKCAYCQGRLFDWKLGDDPWLEHARNFPRCPYIRLCLGDDFVNDVQQRRNTNGPAAEDQDKPPVISSSDLASVCRSGYSPSKRTTESQIDQAMKSRQVEAVLAIGFQRNLVRKIIQTRIPEGGIGFVTADDLASIILESENYPKIKSSEAKDCEVNASKTVCSQSEPESDDLNERFVCKVCMECQIQVTFVPCGHFVCCQCALVLEECPICRTAVSGMVRTYF